MTRSLPMIVTLALAPAVATADPEPAPPTTAPAAPSAAPAKDLRLDALPTKKTMAMRPKQASAGDAKSTTTAAASDSSGGTAASGTETSTSAHFDRFPTNLADLRDRIIFRLNAGYEIDSAPASGETIRGGLPLPPGFNNDRSWISGNAVVGIHDIVLPSLGGYFLTAYQLSADTVSGASSVQSASRSDLVVPGDADGQRAVIKAGYLDYQTDGKDDEHFWLRAGRQFRLDGGAMFAYYDGATAGFNTGGISLSAFAGQRVQLYLDPSTSPTTGEQLPSQCVTNGIAQNGTNCIMNPGIMFGGTLGIDLKKMSGVPVKIGVDYEGLDIDTANGSGDTPINTNQVSQVRSLVAANANIDLSRNSHLDLRARFVDDGSTGFGFGRGGAHLRMALSKDLMLVADIDQRAPNDYAYDLAAASQVDVVDISRRLGVGLAPPIDSTMLGAQLDYRKGNKEALLFARANVAEDTVHFADQQGWEEVGVGLGGAPLPSTWLTGQYSYRHYELNQAAGSDELTTMGSIAFDDLSGSGLNDMHEFSIEGWWRSHRQGTGQLRIGGGFFYRIYDMVTPYEQTSNDGRAGGRIDLAYWITRDLHVIGNAEVAQPSPTLMREIGTMSSGRIALELRF